MCVFFLCFTTVHARVPEGRALSRHILKTQSRFFPWRLFSSAAVENVYDGRTGIENQSYPANKHRRILPRISFSLCQGFP
jgi:hypothetical protein